MKPLAVAIASALAFFVAGCSITKTVKPIASTQISELCINKNPDILMDDFLPELERQIQAHGIKTRVYSGSPPQDCKATMEYAANWKWDMAMYLSYADLRVYDDGELVGQATYDARMGGGRMDKFGKTSEKLKVLIDELFAEFAKKSN